MYNPYEPEEPYGAGGYLPDPPMGVPDPAAAAPPPPWTDPDSAAPDWLYDPNADMSGHPLPPGLRWVFQNGKWETVAMPRANNPTTPPTAPTDPRGYTPDGNNPYVPRTSGIDIGRPPGSMLPYPDYESPGPFTPRDATFEDDPYTPSSWEDAENEPGFAEAQKRLSKMVQNSAAYQGVLRSGATIGELDSVLDTNRGQNFAQFDARRFRNWGANRDDKFRSWSTNYGVDKDAYNFHAQDVDRGNNYRFNVADRSFADELSRWQEQVRSLTQLSRPPE